MESFRRIAPGAYFVAALLVLITLVDYLGNAWPFRPGAIDWRYGVAGMISTYLLSPLLGCLIASVLAALALMVLGRGNLRAAATGRAAYASKTREPARPHHRPGVAPDRCSHQEHQHRRPRVRQSGVVE